MSFESPLSTLVLSISTKIPSNPKLLSSDAATLREFLLKAIIALDISKGMSHVTGVFMVGFFIWGGDEEVVHIDDEPSFCNHVPEGVMHESSEYGWGVCPKNITVGSKSPLWVIKVAFH